MYENCYKGSEKFCRVIKFCVSVSSWLQPDATRSTVQIVLLFIRERSKSALRGMINACFCFVRTVFFTKTLVSHGNKWGDICVINNV